MASVYEAARAIPVLEEADVVVAGGGVAGCAAAWAAARAGARTILLERNGCLGGVATASLMANIGNRFLTATGEQVVHGFPAEVVDRLIGAGAASPLWKTRDMPGVVIDSERLKIVLIEMMREAGVMTLTHALGARPIMDGQAVKGVFLESKSGRQAIPAKAVVDCTGEADLAWQAGAEVRMEGGTGSILFKLANVDLDAFVDFLQEDPEGFPAGEDWVKDLGVFTKNWKERGVLFFPHGGGFKWRAFQEALGRAGFSKTSGPARSLDAMGMYALRGTGFVVINSNFYRVADLDARSLSASELHAQEMCYRVAELLARTVKGFEKAVVAHVGVDLGIRASRIITGRSELKRAALVDAPGPSLCDDVIGVAVVQDTKRVCGEFLKPYTMDLPFGAAVPQGCDNLLVGSAKSVASRPKALLRGMSGCMIYGQASGAACALAARLGVAAADVPIREIQKELIRQGVNLGGLDRLRQLGLNPVG